MHPNPAFRQTGHARNTGFARDRGFGTLAVNGPDGPLVSHVPFLLDAAGTSAELHLLRSNPIARAGDAIPAVIAVTGPDGYISPDWYGVEDQVPTWNYVAVHLRGTLSAAAPEAFEAMLDRLSLHFEERLSPKRPWTSAKMREGLMARMMRAIAPFRLEIAAVEGTWKLNQNKPDAVRAAAAEHVRAYPTGSDAALLAALMAAPPED